MDIEKLIERPKRVEVDGQVVENHDLADIIDLDRYLASKKAMKRRKLPIGIAKMRSGGAIC